MNNTVGTCETCLVFQTLLRLREGARAAFKKKPQGVPVILPLSPNSRLPSRDRASGVLPKKEPGVLVETAHSEVRRKSRKWAACLPHPVPEVGVEAARAEVQQVPWIRAEWKDPETWQAKETEK